MTHKSWSQPDPQTKL